MNFIRPRLKALHSMGVCLLALAWTSPGCKKEAASESAPAIEVAAEEGPKVSPHPVLDLPSDVQVYGAVKSFDALVKFGGELVGDFGMMPPAAVKETLTQGFVNDFGVSNIAWMDASAPIRMVAFADDGGDTGGVALLPVKDEAGLLASLPESKQANDAGNAWSWSSGTRKVYLNLFSGHAVVTENPTRFAAGQEVFKKLLEGLNPEPPVFVHMSVSALMDEFGGLFEQSAQDPSMSGEEKAQLDQLMGLAKSVKSLIFTGTVDEGNLVFAAEAQGSAGEPWSTLVSAIASGEPPRLTGLAPAGSYFVMGSSTDRDAAQKLNKLMKSADPLIALLGFEGAEEKAFLEVMERVESAQKGDQMLALHSSGGFPLGVRSFVSVHDGAKMQAAFLDMMGMFWKGGVGFAKEIAGDSIPPFVDLSSFPAAVQSVAPLLAGFGVKLSHRTDATGGPSAEVIEIGVDAARLEAMKMDPAMIGLAKVLFTEPIQLVMASDKGLFGISIGPGSLAGLRANLAAPVPSDPHPGIRSMDNGAVPGASTLIWVSPLMALDTFKVLDQVKPFAALVEGPPGDAGVGFSIGRVNESTIRMQIDLPREHTRRLVKGVKGAMGAMGAMGGGFR